MNDRLKTSNPAFSNATWDVRAVHTGYGEAMTVSGTVNKAGILLILVLLSAAWTWNRFLTTQDIGSVGGFTVIGAFGGLIAAMVTIFKKQWAPVTAPVYALLEGLFL